MPKAKAFEACNKRNIAWECESPEKSHYGSECWSRRGARDSREFPSRAEGKKKTKGGAWSTKKEGRPQLIPLIVTASASSTSLFLALDMSSRRWPNGLTPAPHAQCIRMPKVMDPSPPLSTSVAELTPTQVDRLRGVLTEQVQIHGKGNFPTITTNLHTVITCLRRNLRKANAVPKCVKINGGAASFAVSRDVEFSDLDLIFPMNGDDAESFEKVRGAVFATLSELIPGNANKARINAETLKDVYVRKMVKVSGEDDRWSLFSLNNDFGKCIELKFVDKMRRQFEFSVDSFQITLDPLIDNIHALHPVVKIESMFGDISTAIRHLKEKMIDTRKPEEIRGGGLLKYCHLYVRGYKPARPEACSRLEKYMCSRFFIDFPDVVIQEQKLRSYLDNHFSEKDWMSSSGDETDSEASTSMTPSSLHVGQAKYDFLILLHSVIRESTVCLMTHDRRQTLAMIDRLAFEVATLCDRVMNMSQSISGHVPKTTLLYLPRNTNQWIPVV